MARCSEGPGPSDQRGDVPQAKSGWPGGLRLNQAAADALPHLLCSCLALTVEPGPELIGLIAAETPGQQLVAQR